MSSLPNSQGGSQGATIENVKCISFDYCGFNGHGVRIVSLLEDVRMALQDGDDVLEFSNETIVFKLDAPNINYEPHKLTVHERAKGWITRAGLARKVAWNIYPEFVNQGFLDPKVYLMGIYFDDGVWKAKVLRR